MTGVQMLAKQPQQLMVDKDAVMTDAQMLSEKPQQAVCGVTVKQVEVMVYDILTKLASKGKIADVLSNNTDLADCGKGQQHISDVSSGVSDVAEHPGGQFIEVPGQPKRRRKKGRLQTDVPELQQRDVPFPFF